MVPRVPWSAQRGVEAPWRAVIGRWMSTFVTLVVVAGHFRHGLGKKDAAFAVAAPVTGRALIRPPERRHEAGRANGRLQQYPHSPPGRSDHMRRYLAGLFLLPAGVRQLRERSRLRGAAVSLQPTVRWPAVTVP